MTRTQRLLVALGLIISLAFLVIAFYGLKPDAIFAALRSVDAVWLAAGVAAFFVSLVLIALRWQFLLRAIKPVPVGYLSELVSICYMGNNVYPLRTGEVLRVVLLQRDYGVPVAKTTTTIFIERIFDGLVMLAFILIPLTLIDIQSPELRTAVSVTTPLFVGGLIVFVVMAARPDWLRRLVALFTQPLPAKLQGLVRRLGDDAIGGLAGLRTPALLAGAVGASAATWLANALVYWLVTFAFGLDVSFAVILTIVGAINLAGAFPVSPGQVGVFEFLMSRVLMAVGVPEATALACALVTHIVIWLPVTLYGFYLLIRRGLGWSAITQPQKSAV